ncbi:hypothetical protein PRIPAC_88864 [Pristionchus pacificus]|uniref:Uncharacterized protein n=1 Tax=Pristionchus pacificus TaxID=54126 RepID=A0A2A6CYK9_PRIPA|nr:hypothetical protein PRIPAC_88864 [Pristionchus pacificus]|eukprot:PDM83111.1 hypothetical protein PRIPAC_37504 [Pristionchus pacificus]
MASREKVLDFVVKERAEDLVSIVQIDNGTLFYWRYSSPQRLYTKNQEAFKITKGENDTTGGKLNRVRSDGKKYAYGMWDDPETGGIVIDDNDDPTREMRLTSTKRNQAIYLSRNKGGPPTVRRLRKDAVVLEIPAAVSTDDRLNTPFFYFKCGTTLYALNTESMTVLPPLKINNIESIDSFAGVFNGVATLQVQMGNARYVVTAQLPKEYIGKTAPDNIRSVPVKNIPVGVKEASKSTQEIGKNAPVTTPEVTVKNVSTGVREASKSVQEGSRLAVASNRDQKNTGTVSNQLILKEVEKLPEHTTVLQVEDGEKTLHLLISA